MRIREYVTIQVNSLHVKCHKRLPRLHVTGSNFRLSHTHDIKSSTMWAKARANEFVAFLTSGQSLVCGFGNLYCTL